MKNYLDYQKYIVITKCIIIIIKKIYHKHMHQL